MALLSIAMISDFFHPNVGGVENHIYMLSVELLRKGHKVIVITHSHPPDRVGIRWLLPGIKVYYIPFTTIASSATLPNFFTFLPYFRSIILRERINIVHAHASLSSLGHEGILHAHHLGVRTVFTDHSLFGFADAASILTNKLLEATLANVDGVICVSHTGRENTVLRSCIPPSIAHVIPNALVVDQFKPSDKLVSGATINIIVISRLAYRKGIDLLVATAPRICALFPNVKFIVGGDGPKLIDLLQMRERHLLQDRIILRGSVQHSDVRELLNEGSIFLNTSLTESFGIAILEAACAGLYVVSTRVGGVPEVLPQDMISLPLPEEDDIVRAMSEAIRKVAAGLHDPHAAHARIRKFYNWKDVTERTERVYAFALARPERDLWTRIKQTHNLGRCVGPIYVVILIVDIFFFAILEFLSPRRDIDYVPEACDWVQKRYEEYTKYSFAECWTLPR
ncbi:glycosyltransferase family 4 protein [Fomitiporia mediterranea MF3/22]|uniref:glycosyltransferase family 4 protein n=1 Tax=Fomitiporia mediterranea (strain MF3/22) TaxID=694068 RepID=UPI0004409C1D|nr:glycosyltransferase family 4 protein [Fomitiporia mediterranea MF3/22]EJD05458.1 glycosyltransferase family 4 protein [Fomitiporia mediterranea MF3/22]